MAQHFLLSAAARSLSLAKVMRLSDTGVEDVFLRLRWPETDGKPMCPGCGCAICYACRRPAGQLRWRCKTCRSDFSITSGILFAWRKLPLRTSLLALARDLDVQTQDGVRAGAQAARSHGGQHEGAAGRRRGTGGRDRRCLTSVATSGRRTGPPTGSTGGWPGTSRASAGPYLLCYAQEAAWREDLRRVGNGEQTHGVVGLAMRSPPSVDVCGYWQRAQAA